MRYMLFRVAFIVAASSLFIGTAAASLLGCDMGLPGLNGSDATVDSSQQQQFDSSALGEDVNVQADRAPSLDAGLADRYVQAVDAEVEIDAEVPVTQIDCNAATGPCACTTSPGTGEGDEYFETNTCYLDIARQAVQQVVASHPAWFGWEDTHNCPLILDADQYMDAVVAVIAGQNLCARRDPNDPGYEIIVMHDISFSENFRIRSSWNCPRDGAPIYQGTAVPAWWP